MPQIVCVLNSIGMYAPDRLCFKHVCPRSFVECMPQIVCVLNSIGMYAPDRLCFKQYRNVCPRSFVF